MSIHWNKGHAGGVGVEGMARSTQDEKRNDCIEEFHDEDNVCSCFSKFVVRKMGSEIYEIDQEEKKCYNPEEESPLPRTFALRLLLH